MHQSTAQHTAPTLSTSSSHEREVACEDLMTFINGCFASTGQSEFFEEQGAQSLSIDFLHEYIIYNYRRLYALTLAADVNHFNKALILFNLLRAGAPQSPDERVREGELIRLSLQRLPVQRAYRLFTRLKKERVNNRRTRAVIKGYIEARRDPFFDAVKYRRHLSGALSHCHVKLFDERNPFLFGDRRRHPFTQPLFVAVQKAHYTKQAVYDLPFSVAEGLAQKHNIPRGEFLKKIKPKMTVQERARLTQSAQREGVELNADLSKLTLTKLTLYFLSLNLAERHAQRSRFEEAFAASCACLSWPHALKRGKIAAILDNSYSSSGSSEKRRRPLAVALGVHLLLSTHCEAYLPLWTTHPGDVWELTPRGPTTLARHLIEALTWGAERVLIISDGHENDPTGALHEVVKTFQERLDPKKSVTITHLNPVYHAGSFEPKRLSPLIPTVGLRDAELMFTALGFSDFATGGASLSDLEGYLASLEPSLTKLNPPRLT